MYGGAGVGSRPQEPFCNDYHPKLERSEMEGVYRVITEIAIILC